MKIKKRDKKRGMNKLGVSLMISYVLLIFITIALSIGVYTWLKDYAVVSERIDCKDGTSLIIESYNIKETVNNKTITLFVKNNGRFNIDGFLITAGNNSQRVPLELIESLILGNLKGHFRFDPALGPKESISAEFSIDSLDLIETVQIQPFILKKNQISRIYCEQALIRQEVLINPSLIPGLVGWWKMNGNVLDYSSNENNGTIIGTPNYTPGRLNQGLEFDLNDYVEAIVTQDKKMVSLWYNTDITDWTHVVFNSSTFYVDGVYSASNPASSIVDTTSNIITIGNGFAGTIDEVAIYDRHLSEWEALQLYNSYNITGII